MQPKQYKNKESIKQLNKVACECCGRYVALAYLANHQKQDICIARSKANCFDVVNELKDVLKIVKELLPQNYYDRKIVKEDEVESHLSSNSDDSASEYSDESTENSESSESEEDVAVKQPKKQTTAPLFKSKAVKKIIPQ